MASDAFKKGGWDEVLKDGGFLLTVGWRVTPPTEEGAFDLEVNKFILSANGSRFPGKKDQDGAEAYFGMLHCSLLPISSQPREVGRRKKEESNDDAGGDDDNDDDEDTHAWTKRVKPLNELHDHVRENDRRMLPRVIHRLICGGGSLDATNKATSPRQTRLISHLISDLIMRLTNPQGEIGHVVDLLSYLICHASQTEQQEVFSELRLVTTRKAALARRSMETVKKMMTRYNISGKPIFCSGLSLAQAARIG